MEPFVLTHSWFDQIDPSAITWRLAPLDDGARPTSTHALPSGEDAPRTAAGGSMMSGALEAWLGGVPFEPSRSWRAWRDGHAVRFGPEAAKDGR